jgi:VWFA-related protein
VTTRNLAALAALTAFLATCPAKTVVAQSGERDVYVTVFDKAGEPVTGLTQEHFAVREDGRDRAVVRVQPFTGPAHIAVLVDTSTYVDSPAGPYRNAIEAFVTKAALENQVAIYEFGERASLLTPFTNDAAILREAVGRLGIRTTSASRLLDAIALACRDLRAAEARRPIIVSVSTGATDTSSNSGGAIVKLLIQNAVSLHAVAVTNRAGPASPSLTSSSGQSIADRHDRLNQVSTVGEGERERTQVLNEGTLKTAGQLHTVASAISVGPALDRVRVELGAAYRVSYAREGSGKSRDLQIGLMLQDVVVRAIAAPQGMK